MTTQLSFLKKPKREHGGSLALNKRRAYRPLNMKQAHHLTLKSHYASGGRCLLKHKALIRHILQKAAKRFGVTVYNHAVAGNHIHLLVKARSRIGLQNFFRVFAGHSAQEILKQHPLNRGGAPLTISTAKKEPCKKNQRKFWGYLIYSRIITWGREYRIVYKYIDQNRLEALNLIAYRPRYKEKIRNTS